MFSVLLITFVFFLLIIAAMAIGVMFKRPCLRGSCGGPDVVGRDGESLTCATCPNRKRARAAAAAGGGLPVVE
ncbi:MAG: hypothetical protein AAGN46_02605 [Acidobacteriota bacterium]